MRFFKSFKLLHRRTKSDPTNAITPNFTKHRQTASICNGIAHTSLQSVASDIHQSPHPYLRILDLEAENTRLRDISAASLKELADTKSLLQATQADLYAELHRSIRQRKEDRNEIDRIREALTQYERFLELVVAAEPNGTFLLDTRASLQAGQTLDQALSNAVERAATSAKTPVADPLSSVLGFRTQDEYMAALQLTLNSRKQLRRCKKIAKFWKNTAKKNGNHLEVITPSASTISSIDEALSAERLEAVNDLFARRRASARSWSSDLVSAPTSDKKATVKPSLGLPLVSQLVLPHSLPQGRPCLSPLASQSLRKELGQIASTNRLSKWPTAHIVGRKPLGEIDLNMRKTSSLARPQGPQSRCSEPSFGNWKSKANIVLPGPRNSHQRNENKHGISPASPGPSVPVCAEIEQARDRPTAALNTSKLYPVNVDSVPSYSLSSISEESDLVYVSNSSSNDTTQERVSCDHKKDNSSNSTVETWMHTSPSIISPRRTEISKSKLPVPVFRTLRRLSSTKLNAAKGKTGPTPLVNRAAAETSPTRLSVRPATRSR